jgi:hypothetical protein
MPVPAQDIPFLKSQGWTDDEIANYNPPVQPQQPITVPQTIGRTLIAHGGGILGGGAGAIGGGALAGTMVEPGIGTIVGGIIGALAGGYAGQKGQQAIESPETYEQQQLLAQQAAEQHPNIAEGTDIAAGALASGGMFSPTTAVKGVGGIIGRLGGKALTQEAKSVLLQSALNPAISTGVSLAQGQGVPSIGELGKQAAGGALFAKSWLPHGRLGEPNPEVNNNALTTSGSQEPTSKPWVSPFTAVDDAGDYKIGNKQIQSLFKKKDSGFLQPVPKDADAITKAYINTANEKLAALPVDQMREMLHQKSMGEKANDIEGVNEPEAGLRSEEEPTGEETPITRALMGLEPRGEINDNTKIPTEDTSATKPVFTTEVLQKIIDKGATKPVSVQRIFPKLNLSVPEATEALRQADLLAELHENRPIVQSLPQGEENATGIRENTGQPSETGQVAQSSQVRGGSNMVEQTPRSAESISQEVSSKLPKSQEYKGIVQSAPQHPESDFISNAAYMIQHPEEMGLYKNQQGAFNGTQLLGTLKNKIPSLEWEMLKAAGIEKAFEGRKISGEDAARWIQDNEPKVEVRKFGEGALSGSTPESAELAQLQHEWKDVLPFGTRNSVDSYLREYMNDPESAGTSSWYNQAVQDYKDSLESGATGFNMKPSEFGSRMRRYAELGSNVDNAMGDNSHWQSIAPKSEQHMPGYVEIAVVKPRKTKYTVEERQQIMQKTGRHPGEFPDQFPSSHNFPPNTLGFVRGYMENVNGEKVFHVIEVQSDWAHRVREYKEAVARNQGRDLYPGWHDVTGKEQDPLLSHYERLALKAAIEHARSQGATKIAISDAETAMMTEGHDRAGTDIGGSLIASYLSKNEAITRLKELKGKAEQYDTGFKYKIVKNGSRYEVHRDINEIKQEPGMRLHYDRTLPKIAEELTGSKGERVSFGEHKNAIEHERDWRPEYGPGLSDRPRSDLIFRNPDGTPKTDVSARVYDISKIPERPPKLFGKNYSPLSDYNRYQELDRQRVAMESKITDPEELMASPEHQAISRELEAIKNRNGGMPPPQFPENRVMMPVQLQSHILNGKATTGSILHGLANTPDHPLQELAKGLLDAADTKSLNVKWFHDARLDKNNGQTIIKRIPYPEYGNVDNLVARLKKEYPGMEILEMGRYNDIKVIDPKTGYGKRTHYDPITDRVNIGTGSAGDARVVMEEAVHSLTSKKIPFFKGQGEEYYNRLNTYLKTGSNEHVKDLIRSYFETAKALGIHPELFKDTEMPLHPKGAAGNPDEAVSQIHGYGATTKYAMGNLDEFIAQAIKDPEFQRVLNGIKTTDNRTVWQTIVDAVRNLLGLDAKAGSMLDRVLRTSGELISQERPEGLTSIKDRVNAPPKEGEHVTPELKPFFGRAGRFFQNAIERARTVAPEVSDAYHRFYNARSEIFGKVYGNVKNVMNRTGFTTEDGKRLIEAQRQEELTGKPIATTFFKNNAQRQVWNEYKLRYKEQGEEAVKDKQPVYDYNQHQFRIRQLSDTSHPMMLNPKIGEILRANTDTEKVDQLKQDFLDNQKAHGVSLTDAQENLATELKAMQGTASNTGSGSMAHFNANRRAQGIPLPPSWQRDNFEQNLRAYASRNAGDRAHYKYIESNPSVMAQLGETHDAWGRPIPPTNKPVVAGNQFVKSLINESKGEVGPQGFYTERAGSSTATALFISSPALSAVHVPISNISGIVGLTRNPIETGRTLLAGLKGMYSGVATANKNGLVIPMARPVSDIWDSSLTTAEHFQAMASIVRRIASFNDIATKANLGYMQAAMEFLVPKRVAQANYGEGVGAKTSQQWLRKLDPDYTIGKQYSPNETQQLASRAVGYLHGTNDPRSMPEWMMRDSEISGFFSIAHWSVAQTDRFMRDVWTPATKGDLTPLVASMFGATLGGYIIKELREQISGKHSPIPSLQEIAASDRQFKGNAGPLAYNMISALQYAGFGGVFSQIAKWPFDVAYKNIPQAAAFPLDEEITDIGGTISNVASALANDPNINYVDLAKNVMAHVLTSDFRLAREGYNQLINNGMITGTLAEKKALSDKMSQLRRFEQVEGLPFNAQDASNANPYMNLEQKKFKLEQDPQKAVAMLPGLISNIIEHYSKTPDVMMGKLKALKENSYSTFPSMEEMPLSFFKYIGYLNRTEGPEAAQAQLMDYMKHKVINEAKSSVVP